MEGEYTLRFVQPWLLMLLPLLALPVVYWWLRGRRNLRHAVALGLRLMILALLVVALARPQSRLEVHRLAVAFTLDVSESVPDAQRQTALDWVRGQVAATPSGDDASLIVFGDRPSVEVPFVGGEGGRRAEGSAADFQLVALQSRLSRAHSDLAGAAGFAEATFPPGHARRVVLISDGNETRGDLMTAARALKAAGVQLDVIPLRYASVDEVRVDSLRAPRNVTIDEPFNLRLTVTAQSATDAKIQLYENGAPAGEPMKVRLEEGLNVYRLRREFDRPGYYQYEVQVEAERDGNAGNNAGRASVLVAGEASVLVVGARDQEDTISPALRNGGVVVESVAPSGVPAHPAGFVNYDCVVLNNVGAFELSESQIESIDNAVRELGMGLVVIGGDRSYGPGGYRGTPLQDLLPVDLDIKNRKHMPKGALVIVLHSIEFDTGNTWAERICKSALKGMDEKDDAGIVYYSDQGEKWLFDLQPVGNRQKQYELIENVRVGDMPSFHRCFVLAWDSLKQNDAAIKHVVVISDGDPQVPDPSLMKELVNGQVTVTTICINPHGPADVASMQALAFDGNGRFYQVQMGGDLQRLPALMLKEAATLRRKAIAERTFVPGAILPDSPMLRGVSALPELHGYVVTAPRPEAETVLVTDDEEDPDPVLATWQAGLGRCTAFTSDATTRWADDWISWSGYNPFWLQVTRATMSSTTEGTLPANVEVRGSNARVVVDARDADGSPITDLELDAIMLGDDPKGRRLELSQVSPGRYEGTADGLEQGHYLLRVLNRDGGLATSLSVFSVDFSEEHRALRSNESLLREAAELTGGGVLDYESNPFTHDVGVTVDSSDLWPWILLVAVGLLICDVAARRLELFGWKRTKKSRPKKTAEDMKTATPMPVADMLREEKTRPDKTPSPEPDTQADASSLDELLKAKKRAEDKRKWQ